MNRTSPASVFVSYASVDQACADSLVDKLEKAGTKCWIAPRDIPPAANYAESIMQAISDCDTFLLAFSKHSNDSQHVQREVERAIHLKKQIVPVRISDVLPSGSMDYYLATLQWIDAYEAGQQQAVVDFFRGGDSCEEQEQKERIADSASAPNRRLMLAMAAIGVLAAVIFVFFVPGKDDTKDDNGTGWKTHLTEMNRRQIADLPRQFEIQLAVPGTDSPSFRIGDPINFTLRTDKEAYVVVVSQSSDGSEVVVYPNTRHRSALLTPGQPLELPGEGMRLTAAAPTGIDVVFAVASTRQSDLEQFVKELDAVYQDQSFATFTSAKERGMILSTVEPNSNSDVAAPLRSIAGLSFRIIP